MITEHVTKYLQKLPAAKTTTFTQQLQSITPDNILYIWVSELLEKIAPLSPAQIQVLLLGLRSEIIAINKQLALPANTQVPVYILSIVDRAYACTNSKALFIDINSGKACEQLPKVPLETISYNLTLVYTLEAQLLA